MATTLRMGRAGVAPRLPIIVSAKLMNSWPPTRPRRANPLPTPTGERTKPHPLKGGIGSGRSLATISAGPLPRRDCNQWPPANILRGLMPPAPPSIDPHGGAAKAAPPLRGDRKREASVHKFLGGPYPHALVAYGHPLIFCGGSCRPHPPL